MKQLIFIFLALAPRLMLADGVIGGTSSSQPAVVWGQNITTNLWLTFNGGVQTYTVPTTNLVNFASFSGNSGSISLLMANTTVTYTPNTSALRWLTVHPVFVTNGIISFTAYGTNVIGAYKECQ